MTIFNFGSPGGDTWFQNQINALSAEITAIEQEDVDRQRFISAMKDSLELQARWAAICASQQSTPLTQGGRENDFIFLSGGDPRMWVAGQGDENRILSVALDHVIDLRWMKNGSADPVTVQTYANSTAVLVTDTGNQTVNSSSFVRIYRDAPGNYHLDTISGSVTSGGATPTANHTIVWAGENLAHRFLDGSSMHGFQLGWYDYNGDRSTKFWTVNGATVGSRLVPASNATNFWRDPTDESDGPAMTAFKQAIDAIPASQPEPSAIIWLFGQSDVSTIGSDSTLTLPNYKATLLSVLREMQDYVNPVTRPPIILCPVGSWDNKALDVGVQSVRWCEMEIIAENEDIHQGPAYFDLVRPWDDVHHGISGQKLLGYRLSATVDNVLNAAEHETGPTVSAIEELNGGAQYRLTISPQTTQRLVRPMEPEGFAVFQNNANPLLDAPIQITAYEWAEGSGDSYTLTLNLDVASPGATVLFPFGSCAYARRGRWPMNERNSGFGNVWPLRPFQSGAT